ALRVAVEHEPAVGRQHPADVGQRLFVPPEGLLRGRIPGDRLTQKPAWPGRTDLEVGAEVERATLVLLGHELHVHTEIEGRQEDDARLRVEGHRHPVLRADRRWADALRPVALPRPHRLVLDRPPGGHVDPAGPGDVLERLRRDELARLSVDDVEEAVPITLEDDGRLLALERQVGDQAVPPPVFHESPFHVLFPDSPGPGTRYVRHAMAPLSWS